MVMCIQSIVIYLLGICRRYFTSYIMNPSQCVLDIVVKTNFNQLTKVNF